MMKKSVYLLNAILIFGLAIPAMAEEQEEVWQYNYLNSYLNLEGELSGDVQVPSEADGYEVKALGGSIFQNQHGITSLTLPDSIEALQNGCISYMDGLESVRLSNNLTVITNNNFSHCDALTSVTIPASVSYIESSFYWNENLKEIYFEGVCPIFMGNDWNFDLFSEDYVIYVPDDQFDAYAEALSEANGAADKLQRSGQNAIVVDFTAPEEDFEFDPTTGTITRYTGNSARVDIPAEIGGVPVKVIGEDAFHGCYSLYYLTIPESVESIENRAFYQASNLCYISLPSTLRTIGEEAFYNAQARRIDWKEGLEEIGARAFQYSFDTMLALPSTVRTIGESAFEGSWCRELYLSGDLESIGSRAFANTSLNYMAFDFYEPIDIAADAFTDTYIADLDLPWDSSFENRDAYAALLVEQCPDCTVWINNPISGGVAKYPVNDLSITTITEGVWTAYHGDGLDLTIWTYYDDIPVTAIGDGLFQGNQSIRSFYPHHCGWFTTIGKEAFADSSVEYVELFGSITTIGEGAFRNCVNMTELTIPASVIYIGEGALEGCTNLKKLTVLCDPEILPENLLSSCTGLEEIYASADATDDQVRVLSARAGRAWNNPVPRVGESQIEMQSMPYEPLPGEDFWYDEEYARLDCYEGYEVNLVLPREIDDVQLTMVGGSVLERASYGDNDEIELPVRSVVIPETYTEIAFYAFENCETLETVVCYAPIEFVQEGTFSGCTNLREVIFVNGVRSLERYVFKDCPNLETVYLGEYVEDVSEYAFLNEDGSDVFALEDCITSADEMPDVNALLSAVKSDPIPEPETTPESEPLTAEPIGEEGAAYFGTWYGTTVEMDGEVYSMADFGMNMQIILNADGTAEFFDGESTDIGVWTFSDGMAYLDTMQMTVTDDGVLCIEEEGTKMNFSREMPEGAAVPGVPQTSDPGIAGGDVDLSERMETKFVMTSADMEGYHMSPAQLGGYEYSLIFHENGTVDFVMAGASIPGLKWTQGKAETDTGETDAFLIDYYGNELVAIVTDAGFDMNYFDAMMIHFEPETK